MAYSEEVKKAIFKRIEKKEKIDDISKDTGISKATLYNWKNSEEYKKYEKAKQASKEIKELIEQRKLKEAEAFCRKEEFKDNEIIQSQLVSILIQKGDKKSLEEAEKMCRENLDHPPFCLQLINILLQKGDQKSLKEASKILEEKLKDDKISGKQRRIFKNKYKYVQHVQSKRVELLIKKRDKKSLEEAEKMCRENYADRALQSQLVEILIKKRDEKSLEEASKICEEKLKDDKISEKQRGIFKNQLEKVKEALEQIRLDKELFKNQEMRDNTQNEQKTDESAQTQAEKVETTLNNEKLLNTIKTKLYYDDITPEFIEQIKLDNIELTAWKKTIALLAIYDKQKNTKTAEKILKEGKRTFKEEAEKVKTLNKIQNVILSKKHRIFDWTIFDELLDWSLDKNIYEEIEAKRKVEEAKEREKQEKLDKEIAQSRERKQQKITKKTVRTEYFISQSRTAEESTSNVDVKPKTSAKKSTKTNPKAKEKRIGQIFRAELARLKGNILWAESRMDYEEKRLKIPNNIDFKKYRISEADMNQVKEKINQDREIIKDLDKIERLSEKTEENFRAKIQLVLLFRKYGMKEVADERLEVESEIYDNINQMILHQKRHPKQDNSEELEKIMKNIEKIEGDKEYAYKLVDKAMIKYEDESR